MKSRVLSDMKPIKPKKCEFDSNDCTPVYKYIRHVYTACTSRLCLYIYRRKEKP